MISCYVLLFFFLQQSFFFLIYTIKNKKIRNSKIPLRGEWRGRFSTYHATSFHTCLGRRVSIQRASNKSLFWRGGRYELRQSAFDFSYTCNRDSFTPWLLKEIFFLSSDVHYAGYGPWGQQSVKLRFCCIYRQQDQSLRFFRQLRPNPRHAWWQ